MADSPWSRGAIATMVIAAVMSWGMGSGAGWAEPRFAADELLVGFRGGVTGPRAEGVYRAHGGAKVEELAGLNVHRIRVPAAALGAVERGLAARPEVRFVERNWLLPPAMTVNDPYYAKQWYLPHIGTPQAWDVTLGTPEVVVAILDTGVDPTHADLKGKLVAGYNFVTNTTTTADGVGHGTSVAGAAAAAGNNGIGVAGVAVRNGIMPIVVGDAGGAYIAAVAKGMTWAADRGAKVLNLSIGGVAGFSTITTAAQYVRGKGGVVVAAAGNCGCVDATPENPYLISVSATDSYDRLASWSSRGEYVDVAAPGQNLYSTAKGGGYQYGSGTSMASPVVAGVVALMMSANPGLGPTEIEALLKETAVDLGTAGWDASYGYGRVDAQAAVMAAKGAVASVDTSAPTVSVTSPGSGTTVSGTTSVAVSATDNVGVARVDLYVDGVLQGTDTSSPFGFAWDTTRVGDGSHTLVAKAYDAAGNEGVSGARTVTVANGTVKDTTTPTTSITAIWVDRRKLKIRVAAADNVGVVKVELYIDGTLRATSATATTYSFNVRQFSSGAHSFKSKAYDAAGNVGQSVTLTFSLQ